MKLRKAQSEMKGIKLQYTEEQRVIMFDDVAGIGEAKVCLGSFESPNNSCCPEHTQSALKSSTTTFRS